MSEISLGRGYVTLVDDADYDDLVRFKWHAIIRPRTIYVSRIVRSDGSIATEYMHRRLLPGVPNVDHVNHDGLDNRRANLRAATEAQNTQHRAGVQANNTSGYLGVSWRPSRGKWEAHIKVGRKHIHLGRFTDPMEAAVIRDRAALKYHGEFASLNFTRDEVTP